MEPKSTPPQGVHNQHLNTQKPLFLIYFLYLFHTEQKMFGNKIVALFGICLFLDFSIHITLVAERKSKRNHSTPLISAEGKGFRNNQ